MKNLFERIAYVGYKEIIKSLSGETIHYIGGAEALPKALDKDEEELLLARLDTMEAKNKLIEHNLRLVVYIAKKFENTNIYIEDLISIGTIGLIKAVNTFKPDKKIKLATYASRCIENEILMYLRKYNARRSEVSFDEPLNVDWDGNELLLSDILGTENDTVEASLEEAAELQLLKGAMMRLNQREREIINLRYGLEGRREKTQKEVADLLGISQSYISRLEKKIMSNLKKDILKNL
ncbi:MAG: RNA polymerase sporulation sigma factor SigE [Clostridia bacterium]|nr:RNA polymerase sporulation sigma factor SigE [Clostridia bacterium]